MTKFQPFHPRRTAIGATLARCFPVPGHDAEEQAEKHELRRIDLKQAVK